MKEHKFKAWDIENKRWIYLVLQGPDVIVTTEDGTQTGEDLRDLKMTDWLQCTDLKDKNGDDIYEGDIVKLVRCGCGKECCHSFNAMTSTVKYYAGAPFPFSDMLQGDTYQDSSNYQVAGNINSK